MSLPLDGGGEVGVNVRGSAVFPFYKDQSASGSGLSWNLTTLP